MLLLFFSVILVALILQYINVFHDTANSIASVVSTKVLTPRQAVLSAAGFHILGALYGTAVASTMGKGLVDTRSSPALTFRSFLGPSAFVRQTKTLLAFFLRRF